MEDKKIELCEKFITTLDTLYQERNEEQQREIQVLKDVIFAMRTYIFGYDHTVEFYQSVQQAYADADKEGDKERKQKYENVIQYFKK